MKNTISTQKNFFYVFHKGDGDPTLKTTLFMYDILLELLDLYLVKNFSFHRKSDTKLNFKYKRNKGES